MLPGQIIIQHHGHLYKGYVEDYIRLCRSNLNPDGSEDGTPGTGIDRIGLSIATAEDLVEYNKKFAIKKEG